MTIIEAIQIIVNEAEVSAIGESTEEHKKVLEACEKVQHWLNNMISFISKNKHIKNN